MDPIGKHNYALVATIGLSETKNSFQNTPLLEAVKNVGLSGVPMYASSTRYTVEMLKTLGGPKEERKERKTTALGGGGEWCLHVSLVHCTEQ